MVLTKFSKILGLCSFILISGISCKVDEKLPDLGERLAGAVDLATAPSGSLFYVLNSDYERRYDKGSLLIVDPAAAEGSQKIKAISTPRMGRSLHVSANQKLLLATYADEEARQIGLVEIWDLANEREPTLIFNTKINCQPLNAVLAPTQPYFAVSCVNGDLFMGKNPRNTADAPMTLERVRSYAYERRALYFYESGATVKLLGFPTDIDKLDYTDETLEDSRSYDAVTDAVTNVPNGIPDAFELTESARRRWATSSPYQMFIYPVSDEDLASKAPQTPETPAYINFRYVAPGSYTKPSISNLELHYISYNLLEADGQSSPAEQIVQPNFHRYRTNFWEAKGGLEASPNIFYLSQRGDYGSQSNNVLKLTINEASLAASNTSSFEQIFAVSRVYGFAIDRDNSGRYPGDFELGLSEGEPMLLVNSFRDLIYFAGAPFYSITRKLLDGPNAAFEVPSSHDSADFNSSYYQLAYSPTTGKALTSSFYGDVLYLFDARPSISIKDQSPIRIE